MIVKIGDIVTDTKTGFYGCVVDKFKSGYGIILEVNLNFYSRYTGGYKHIHMFPQKNAIKGIIEL